MNDADGIGYIIPTALLLTVLAEYEKKCLSSLPPILGPLDTSVAPVVGTKASPLISAKLPLFGFFDAQIMKLENPSLRCYYALPKGYSGVFITDISKLSWLHGHLGKGDIVVAIEGLVVGFDGTISMDEFGRVDFRSALTRKLEGNSLHLKIFRQRVFHEVCYPR